MEVRIRHADDTESRLLAEIPFRKDAIDSVIPTLTAWGVVSGSRGLVDDEDVIGQFVDNGTTAYFEVVLGG